VEGTQPEQTDVGAAETGDSTASDADLMKLGF
jgi:hypothetical protein